MKALAFWLRGWTRGDRGAAHRGSRRYIVDATAVFGSRGDRVPMAPREIIAALQRLTRFAQRERLKIQAVFLGEALRKAPDGAEFGDMEVFYAADPAERVETIARLAQKARRPASVTVITADAVAEQRAQSLGCAVMRAATFRKGLELALSGGGPAESASAATGDTKTESERAAPTDRGDRERRRRRGGRGRGGPDRERSSPAGAPGAPDVAAGAPPPGSAPDDSAGGAGAAPAAPAQTAQTTPLQKPVSDEVRRLIDLVE